MTDKLILALDVDTAADALALVRRLKTHLGLSRSACNSSPGGARLHSRLAGEGVDVFLDLKFHDIPQTVSHAVRAAAALDVRFITNPRGRRVGDDASGAGGDRWHASGDSRSDRADESG